MKKLALVLVLLSIAVTPVFAQPFTPGMAADTYDSTPDAIPTPRDNNDNLAGVPNPADINDAINRLLGTGFARNSDVDHLRVVTPDSTWTDISGTADADGAYVLISLTAANSNTLRVYDVTDPGTKIAVLGPSSGFGYTGDGTIGDPYDAAYSPLAFGVNFGWSLRSVGASSTNIWDSDPTLNAGGLDHMLTYHLAALSGKTIYIKVGSDVVPYTFYDPYLLAWEDKPLLSGKLGDEDYDDLVYLVDRVRPIPEPMSMLLLGSGLVGMAGLRRKKA